MKPHISKIRGVWWVRPIRGAMYGCAGPDIASAWQSWRRNTWLMAAYKAMGEKR
ncbi:hypothetical protein C7410_115191 [Paraburkholderia silvatlantica]|uniref:Uncharacterized protein n=1 Tax=Paraburkholderia silvatlantica TaxID=321895 RepID=A0A2V4TJD2_9BURK|nr:hypothetical protein C7410_115191 [Paraburkholderia silvatlantica]